MTEEKQNHGTNGQEGREHGQPHERGGGLEGVRGNAHEVVQPALALLPILIGVADGPQPELSRILTVYVPYPLWCDKRYHPDDRVADREDGPQHADGFGVADVTRRVDLGRVHVLYLGTHFSKAFTQVA